MNPETISLVERFLLGEEMPLFSAMGRLTTDPNAGPEAFEMVKAYNSAQIVRDRLKDSLSTGCKIIGFDGSYISVGCGRHPPMLIALRSANGLRLPGHKNKDMAYSFALPPRVADVLECKECRAERTRNSLIVYGQRVEVCAKHNNILLDARGLCEKCEESTVSKALNGESVSFVKSEGRYSHYICPLHGPFKAGHRAQGKCPTCDSIDGIAAYALTVPFEDRATHIQLKRLLAARADIKRPAVSDSISVRKTTAIKQLVKRLTDIGGHLHFLHIYPTRKLISGEWAAEVEDMPGLPLHFEPTPQQEMLRTVVAMDKAMVQRTIRDHKERHDKVAGL